VKHLFITVFLLLPVMLFAQLKNITLEDREIPKPAMQDSLISNFNSTQAAYTKLNDKGREFLYWVNYSRANPKRFWDSVVQPIVDAFPTLKGSYTESLKADLYASPSLPLLKLNDKLLFTAQSHASDIGLKKAPPSHNSTDGRTFTDRVRAAGIESCWGENIFLGSVDPVMSLVLLYIDYDLVSLGHRKSLLNPEYVETGIGISPYGDTDDIFIVQDFACAQ
jgi:hypothetical protein